MNYYPQVPVLCLFILALAAAVCAGCVSPSSEIVPPRTTVPSPGNLKAADCFFRVNDTAHSIATGGSSRQIIVTGYVSNICGQPMDKLAVRGTFYDTNGKAFASTEGYAGYVGIREIVPFSLTAETEYAGPFTYELVPEIREQRALF